MVKSRSVHFSTDVLVAHPDGLGPETLLLSSAPLKESASDDEEQVNFNPAIKNLNFINKLSKEYDQFDQTNYKKTSSIHRHSQLAKPSAPLPYRKQFRELNTSKSFLTSTQTHNYDP